MYGCKWRSSVRSFVRSFVHSFIRSFVHSFIYVCVDEGLSYFFIEICFCIDTEIKVAKTFGVSKVLLQEAMPPKKIKKLTQRKKRAASQSCSPLALRAKVDRTFNKRFKSGNSCPENLTTGRVLRVESFLLSSLQSSKLTL